MGVFLVLNAFIKQTVLFPKWSETYCCLELVHSFRGVFVVAVVEFFCKCVSKHTYQS